MAIEIKCTRDLPNGKTQTTVLNAKDEAQASRFRRTLNIEQRTRYTGSSQTITARTK